MLLYLYSIISGIVQAATEFLPVSSSGHLVVLHEILDFHIGDTVAFDVALHLGTALALVIFFRKEIFVYLKAIITIFRPSQKVNQRDLKDIMLIIYGSIPAMILGFVFSKYSVSAFRQVEIVVIMLVAVALLFFAVEKKKATKIGKC